MHRPHHWLAGVENLADVAQREHALVHPVQVDDIGFLELRQTGDIGADVGNVNLEEVLPQEVQAPEHRPALPKEVPLLPQRLRQSYHCDVIALLVAHQHLGLLAVVVQRVLQPVGSQCRPSRHLTRIDNQYPHG